MSAPYIEACTGSTRLFFFFLLLWGVGLSLRRPDQMRQYSSAALCEGLKMDGPAYGGDGTPPLGGLAWWSPSIRGPRCGCVMRRTACGRAIPGRSGGRVLPCPVVPATPPPLSSITAVPLMTCNRFEDGRKEGKKEGERKKWARCN